jgi:hypothetical protein
MTFEYLTPAEVAEHGLSPEEAEREEAARKREAARRPLDYEAIRRTMQQAEESCERAEAQMERLRWLKRPNLVLVEAETDADA